LKKDPAVHKSWALYLSKFLNAYKDEGIDFWGITPQNEPNSNGVWETCVYTPEEERDFVKNYLGPMLEDTYPGINIIMLDDDKEHLLRWTKVVLSDPAASKYIQGIGFHWYWMLEDFQRLDQVHQMFPDKFLLPTEACNCPGVAMNNWFRGEEYAIDILGDLNHWSVGWVDWNMVLDPFGGPNHGQNFCDAPVIADPSTGVVFYQPTYYVLGHFSRFIPPGSVRVGHTNVAGYGSKISATTFLTPDNDVVLVVLNTSDDEVTFKIEDLSGYYAKGISLPHCIQTYVYPAIEQIQ
jgi:glucosylceramidase